VPLRMAKQPTVSNQSPSQFSPRAAESAILHLHQSD